MKIAVTKTTKYSHNGYQIVEYVAGRTYDVDEQCAKTAAADKWGTLAEEQQKEPKEPKEPKPNTNAKGKK